MIIPFYSLLLVTCLGVAVYWLAPGYRVRVVILCILSAALIFAISPLALLTLLLLLAIYLCLHLAKRAGASVRQLKMASWTLFAPIALPTLISSQEVTAIIFGPEHTISPEVAVLAYLGLSYSAIRVFIAFREEIADGAANRFALAATMLFFGSFPAGPIVGARPYYAKNIASHLLLSDAIWAVARIGWGAAKLLILSRAVSQYAGQLEAMPGAASAWGEMYLRWLALYLDFSGYTDLAIGLAKLFGIRLPENFRNPFLSSSIQEYWQRWHLSLGAFISTYLFKPLVRKFGNPALAIFAAFLFVGIWHEVSVKYFVWGVAHGSALALQMIFARRFAEHQFRNTKWWTIAGWVMTMTWVSYISMFANSISIFDSLEKTGRLIGL